MQRDGDEPSRRSDRYSLRRDLKYFSPSRSGNRAKRRCDRQEICALLAALRTSARRQPENVEIARQFLYPARYHRQRIQRARGPLRLITSALPRAIEFHFRRNGGVTAGVNAN